jgi:hypothetical protein
VHNLVTHVSHESAVLCHSLGLSCLVSAVSVLLVVLFLLAKNNLEEALQSECWKIVPLQAPQ